MSNRREFFKALFAAPLTVPALLAKSESQMPVILGSSESFAAFSNLVIDEQMGIVFPSTYYVWLSQG